MDRLTKTFDWGLLTAALLMAGFGIVFVYSSSFALAENKFGGADYFLVKQVMRALLGIGCLIVFINLDYHVIGRMGSIAYVGAVVLLVYVLLLPESMAINGARRWIHIGGVVFQVSELARVALIIALATQCDRIGDRITEVNGITAPLVKIAIVCGLIVLEPGFSTALITAIVGLAILFMSGARFWHLSALVLSAIPFAAAAVLTTPYRRRRVLGFLNPGESHEGVNYQVSQALIGMGHGGIFGVGLGEGTQKYFYLPEPHTDFMFAILGEEIGFVGLALILAVFSFIVYRGARISMRAPDRMGQLMAFGLTMVLALYVVLHAMVNTGLVPTTGVPLPFLSYGGMSLVFTMAGIGILLNISSQGVDRKASPTAQAARSQRSTSRNLWKSMTGKSHGTARARSR